MRKRIISAVLSLFMLLTLMAVPTDIVHAANATISVNASTVKIGDSITVSVAVPDGITATIDVSYPSNLVSFSNCSTTANNTGTAVSMNLGSFSSRSATITFSAKAAGAATFAVTPITAGSEETAEEVALGGASVNVSIENQASVEQPVVLSDDNNLSALQISTGTLSPAFQPGTTNYKVSVNYDITKVSVSAVAAHQKAKITSVTGGNDLQVGDNTISIVVQAENGVAKTYTIVVTRAQQPATQQPSTQQPSTQQPSTQQPSTQQPSTQQPSTQQPSTQQPNTQKPEQPSSQPVEEKKFSWNGSELEFVSSIPNSAIPYDFEKSTKMFNNKEVPILDFKNGTLTVLYLANENNQKSLFVYDTDTQDVYPFVLLGNEENYVIVLRPNDAAVPLGYSACTLSLEGKGVVDAYRFTSQGASNKEENMIGMFGADVYYATEANPSDFYLIYCMNSKGEKGWYQYDAREKTFQRYAALVSDSNPSVELDPESEEEYKTLQEELEDAKQMKFIILIGASVVVVILLVIIIVLAIKLGKQNEDEDDEEDDFLYDEDEFYEEEAPMTVLPDFDKIDINKIKVEMIPEVVLEEEDDEMEIEFHEVSDSEPEEKQPVKHVVIEISEEDIYEEEDDDDSDLEFIELD